MLMVFESHQFKTCPTQKNTQKLFSFKYMNAFIVVSEIT